MQTYNSGECIEKHPKDIGPAGYNAWLCMQQLSRRDMAKKPTYNKKNYDYWQNLKPDKCRFKHFESEGPQQYKTFSQNSSGSSCCSFNGLPNYEEFERNCRKEYEEMQRSRQCGCDCHENKCCPPVPRTITGQEKKCTCKIPPQCQCPPECPPCTETITGREGACIITPPPSRAGGLFQSQTAETAIEAGSIPFNVENSANLNIALNPQAASQVTAKIAGVYQVFYYIDAAAIPAAGANLLIAVNGTLITASAVPITAGITENFYLVNLNVGDYVTLVTTGNITLADGVNAQLLITKI